MDICAIIVLFSIKNFIYSAQNVHITRIICSTITCHRIGGLAYCRKGAVLSE